MVALGCIPKLPHLPSGGSRSPCNTWFLHPTHTHLTAFFSRTSWVDWYQKDKQFWIFWSRDDGWQWHSLDHMQVICTLPQADNDGGTSSLSFLQASFSSWYPTNSIKALKEQALKEHPNENIIQTPPRLSQLIMQGSWRIVPSTMGWQMSLKITPFPDTHTHTD